jgi:hypothetical protein
LLPPRAPMRLALISPVAALVVLSAACGGARTDTRAPNPSDKPGGAVNMQPGSGGTYGDVVRSEGGEDIPIAPAESAAPKAPVAPEAAPKEPAQPHPRS